MSDFPFRKGLVMMSLPLC